MTLFNIHFTTLLSLSPSLGKREQSKGKEKAKRRETEKEKLWMRQKMLILSPIDKLKRTTDGMRERKMREN